MHNNSNNTAIGDGIAIGHNNRITVDKRSYHQSGDCGSRGNGKGEFEVLVVLSVAVAAGVAFSSWQFARFAPAVYLALALTASAAACSPFYVAACRFLRSESWWAVGAPVVAMVAAIAVLVATLLSRDAYPAELTEFAHRVNTWKGFVCGLKPAWREFSVMQMIAMCGLAAPASLLLATYAAGATLAEFVGAAGGRFVATIIRTTAKPTMLWGAVLCALSALASQSETAYRLWASFIAPALEPMFTTGGVVFSFCR